MIIELNTVDGVQYLQFSGGNLGKDVVSRRATEEDIAKFSSPAVATLSPVVPPPAPAAVEAPAIAEEATPIVHPVHPRKHVKK